MELNMEADNKWEFAAAILWPKLIECAKNGNFITYTAAAQWCGYKKCPTGFGNVLGMIANKCDERVWPRLNTLVVQQGSGHAGDGVIGDPALDPPEVFTFFQSDKFFYDEKKYLNPFRD
jgi:hypothetical protein